MDTRKIVINGSYGGFGLSAEGMKLLRKKLQESGKIPSEDPEATEEDNAAYRDHIGNQHYTDVERDCPELVQVVEELGSKASGSHAQLHIVEIPSDVEWQIEEYDGLEHIAEKHRTWY